MALCSSESVAKERERERERERETEFSGRAIETVQNIQFNCFNFEMFDQSNKMSFLTLQISREGRSLFVLA